MSNDWGARPAFLLAILVSAAVALSAFSFATDGSRLWTLAPLGVLAGCSLLALAFARFDVFVLAVLVTRTSLDAFKLGSSASIPDPAALMGILLIGVSVIWLATETRAPDARPFSKLSWAAMSFVGIAFLGVLTSPTPVDSFIEWSRLASMLLMFLVVERLAARPARRGRIVAAIGGAAVVPLVMAGYQLATNTNLFAAGGFERIRGTFTHSNPLAAFLALLVVVAFAVLTVDRDRHHRALAATTLALALPGLYLTYTRAAWMAAAVGLTVVCVMLGRRAVLGLAAAATLVVLLVPGVSARFADLGETETARGQAANSLTWRVDYWTESIDLAAEAPVTGIGLKQIAAQAEEAKQPHNDFVRSYVELGVAGSVAYVYLVWQYVVTARRAATSSRRLRPSLDKAVLVGFAGAATGYVLMGLVMNLMTQVVVGMYFYAIAGLAVAILGDRAAAASAQPAAAEPAGRSR
jgi:O-antigen ligase